MLWLAVAPWVFFVFEGAVTFPRSLHALVLIQGALTSFAAGFLFMMMPRRLESAFAANWQMALALLVPPVHALLVWRGMSGMAHAVWAVEALMLLLFAGRRVLGWGAGRRGPAAFVWIPIGFFFGCVGALLLSFQALVSSTLSAELLVFGWLLLTQGLFMCLVFGVGALFVPLVTQKESSVDAERHADAGRRRLAHLLSALAMLFGFALEASGAIGWGRGFRAIVALAVLMVVARIHRRPTIQGTQRWLIWMASWCLPVGLALAAAIPSRPQIGLHVFLLGGIALMTLSVAMHVALAHSADEALVFRPVMRVRIFGGLMVTALLCRAMAEIDMIHHFDWVAGGAMLFLLALLFWGQLVLPRLLPPLFSGWKR